MSLKISCGGMHKAKPYYHQWYLLKLLLLTTHIKQNIDFWVKSACVGAPGLITTNVCLDFYIIQQDGCMSFSWQCKEKTRSERQRLEWGMEVSNGKMQKAKINFLCIELATRQTKDFLRHISMLHFFFFWMIHIF